MNALTDRSVLADDALGFLGYPSILYRKPEMGIDVSGFDCSGFLKFLLDRRQFPLDRDVRHTNEFFDKFGIFIHSEAVSKGDLVFWSWDGIVPRHIGIMISKTEYVHSPGRDSSTVGISRIEIREIASDRPNQIYFRNPIGFKRIAIRKGRYCQVL